MPYEALIEVIPKLLAASAFHGDAALFGARNRDSWGIGRTILTALGNLLPLLPAEETRSLSPSRATARSARGPSTWNDPADGQPTTRRL
jgi:hypothetical protein